MEHEDEHEELNGHLTSLEEAANFLIENAREKKKNEAQIVSLVSENHQLKRLLTARDDTIHDLMGMIQSLLKKQGDLVSGLLHNNSNISSKASKASSPTSVGFRPQRDSELTAVLDSLDSRMAAAKDSNRVLKQELESKITELEGKRAKLESLLATSVNELGHKLDADKSPGRR